MATVGEASPCFDRKSPKGNHFRSYADRQEPLGVRWRHVTGPMAKIAKTTPCTERRAGGLFEAMDRQLFDRKPDPERCAAEVPIFCRYQPMVRLDNGSRDGQSHAHALRLAGEKRFEDLLQLVLGNAGPAIRHR